MTRDLPPPPAVTLRDSRFPAAEVCRLVRLSREVARRNGNRTWDAPISAITGSSDHARELIGPDENPATNAFSGMYWPSSRVIWVSTRYLREAVTQTLAHEVAHALSRGAHGRTWRRMYVLLAPLWVAALAPRHLRELSVRELARRTVQTYRRRSGRELEVSDLLEIDGHVAAQRRAWTRWVGAFTAREDGT